MTPPPAQLLIGSLILAVLLLSVFATVSVMRHSGCKQEIQDLLARLLPALQPQLHYRWDLSSGRIVRDVALVERLGFSSPVCVASWQDWAALILPPDRDAYERAVSAVESGKSDRYLLEYRIRARNGSVIRVVDQGIAEAPRADGRGRLITGSLGVLEDRTASGEIAREGLVPVVPTEYVTRAEQVLFGRSGGVLFASQALRPFLADDLDDSRHLGQRTLRAASPVDIHCLDDLWRQAERRGMSRRRVWLSTAESRTRLFDVTLVNVNAEFARSEMLLEARDVTDNQLDESEQVDTQRLELVSRYARRFAHDVRTPLGTIRNLTELIRRSPETGELHERYVDAIDRAIEEISAATRELGRVAEWNEDSTWASNLSTVLEAIVSEFSAEYSVHGNSITIPQDARALAMPESALRVVARSLLREVYEATLGEGGVHVMATRVDDDVVIRVESDDALLPAHSGAPGERGRAVAPPREINAKRVRVASEVLSVFGATLAMSRTPTGGTLFEVRCPASVPVH
ncbi:MAG TPA: histidine kinase dimerization/phospho-acceptor domain-containing protein [Gemmatimonas sp.]|nr:histidine kinase dimerization/phospho-acceptor domain-containing protein [Gemmatimonas sp.]